MLVWYTVRTERGLYRVTKFDELLNPLDSYYVFTNKCTCPAGGKPGRLGCRHRMILDMFWKEHRINSGWFYCYDTNEWDPPIRSYWKGEPK